MEGHALGNDQIGEVVDAVDDEEEREEGAAEAERRQQLTKQIAVEHRHGWQLHFDERTIRRVRSLALALLLALGFWGWLTALPVTPVHARARAGASDRLERFRELATSRLGAEQLLDSERPHEAHRE